MPFPSAASVRNVAENASAAQCDLFPTHPDLVLVGRKHAVIHPTGSDVRSSCRRYLKFVYPILQTEDILRS